MSAATPERIAEVAKINAGAYKAEIPAEAEPGRRLVISYGGVAPDEAEAHIRKIVNHVSRYVQFLLHN